MNTKILQNHPPLRLLAWLLSGYLLTTTFGHAQVLIDLTDASLVRTNGAYTYYAEQTAGASSFFTTEFYPGPANHDSSSNPGDRDGTLDDSVTTPAPISIGSGELTDYSGSLPNNSTTVSGFVGVTSNLSASTSASPGTFDLVFNLGAVYNNISEVVVNYTDSAGHRYVTTVGAQSVYYGLSAPNTTSTGGLTLFGTGTITAGGTNANLTFTSSGVSAEYLDIRLDTSVAGAGSGSVGGYINSVQILETAAVPEPSTSALVLGFLPVLWLICHRRKTIA